MHTPVLATSILIATLLSVPAAAADASKTITELTRGMTAQPGFVEVWPDTDKDRVLLNVASVDQPFLMYTSLPH